MKFKTESRKENCMTNTKKNTSFVKIYSANGKYVSRLKQVEGGGWFCEFWSSDAYGKSSPLIRNIKPFATREEAIQMAQEAFVKFTGDDRYITDEDFSNGNKPD